MVLKRTGLAAQTCIKSRSWRYTRSSQVKEAEHGGGEEHGSFFTQGVLIENDEVFLLAGLAYSIQNER